MAKVLICDICRRKSSEVFGPIKQIKTKRDSEHCWQTNDICEDCLLEIRKRIRERSLDNDIVQRVIDGEFGNGPERRKRLTEAGYNYARVQNAVNERLGCPTRH